MRAKYTVKWDVQITGMIFQTRSGTVLNCIYMFQPCFYKLRYTIWK
ncbi:DUF6783 domain-containing protein [Blautia sp.]